MKNCERYAALLDMYADGFCTVEESETVRSHLAECGECRAYVESILRLREDFPDAESTEVPAGFAEGVMAVIRAEAAPRKRSAFRWKALLPMAACLAVVLAVGGYLPRMMVSDGGAAPEMAMDNRSLSGGAIEVYDYLADAADSYALESTADASKSRAEDPQTVCRRAEVYLTRSEMTELLSAWNGEERPGCVVYELTAAEFDEVVAVLEKAGVTVACSASETAETNQLIVYPTE